MKVLMFIFSNEAVLYYNIRSLKENENVDQTNKIPTNKYEIVERVKFTKKTLTLKTKVKIENWLKIRDKNIGIDVLKKDNVRFSNTSL